MNKAWVPAVSPPSLATALSVPFHSQETIEPDLYRELLIAKLDALIQATNPVQAKWDLQLSLEYAPNLYAIATSTPRHQWASAIVQSDQVSTLLSGLSWEGTVSEVEPQSFEEVLQAISR